MISYNYTITDIHADGKNMTVQYSAIGKQSIDVVTPVPTTTQQLSDIIQAYSPIRIWEQSELEYQTIAVGTAGTITPPVITVIDPAGAAAAVAAAEAAATAQKIAQIRTIIQQVIDENKANTV